MAVQLQRSFAKVAAEARDDKRQTLQSFYGSTIYDSRTTDSNDTQWDAKFNARVIRGGGLSYRDFRLAACVRYSVPLQATKLTITPIVCPDKRADAGSKDYGDFDGSIMLDAHKLQNLQVEQRQVHTSGVSQAV